MHNLVNRRSTLTAKALERLLRNGIITEIEQACRTAQNFYYAQIGNLHKLHRIVLYLFLSHLTCLFQSILNGLHNPHHLTVKMCDVITRSAAKHTQMSNPEKL